MSEPTQTQLMPFNPAPGSMWIVLTKNDFIAAAEVSNDGETVQLAGFVWDVSLTEIKQWIAEIRVEDRAVDGANTQSAEWYEGQILVDNYSKKHLRIVE